MTSPLHPDAKVLFRVLEDDGTINVETLWATSLGDDKYKIDNSPFWAYGVSWEDVVFAPFSETDGHPAFQFVVAKSGNRTVRVIFDIPIEDRSDSDRTLQDLVALGCSYEGANRKYVSVNIPPGVDLDQVCNYLVENDAKWELADPAYETLHPEDA